MSAGTTPSHERNNSLYDEMRTELGAIVFLPEKVQLPLYTPEDPQVIADSYALEVNKIAPIIQDQVTVTDLEKFSHVAHRVVKECFTTKQADLLETEQPAWLSVDTQQVDREIDGFFRGFPPHTWADTHGSSLRKEYLRKHVGAALSLKLIYPEIQEAYSLLSGLIQTRPTANRLPVTILLASYGLRFENARRTNAKAFIPVNSGPLKFHRYSM